LITVNNKVELTPLYDMLCAAVYPNLSQRLAFKNGGKNRPDRTMARHSECFANEIETKPKFVIAMITDMRREFNVRKNRKDNLQGIV
jgi:serine/threonine-protein kinase HipA